ncbi:tripartite tricarboxylate transporter TctB family protein [Afipia sp. 1NLS2]|uniref:tripartite tricarboxylate transporter TctB family protein n=1 Tax=Afipia sp. 1NLS2 TaxID=666684 RepID=UPI00058C94C8|nr:tripartite tricarboxylate transporter TctB family protein [Afipia sp. 1NLS2]
MSSKPMHGGAESGAPVSPLKWLRELGPYILIIGAAIYFYRVASEIPYTEIPGQMGPERWPKIIIALLIAVCAFEVVRRIFVSVRPRPVSDAASEADEGFSQQMEAHPLLVAAATAATVGYLLLFDLVGFFVATALYLVAVMWIGGVRRPVFLGLLSLAISFAFSFFFMKLIYVALPLGEGPFARISLIVMKLVGAN